MQENDFEKQMQLKIDELKIHPSASVWPDVEAAIAKNRRRRRVWLLLPILFIGLLTGGYLLRQPRIDYAKVNRDMLLKNAITKDKTPVSIQPINGLKDDHDNNINTVNNKSLKRPAKIITLSINKEKGIKIKKAVPQSIETSVSPDNFRRKLSTANPLPAHGENAGREDIEKKETGNKEVAAIKPPETEDLVFSDGQNVIKESALMPGENMKAANTVTKWDSSLTNIITTSQQENVQVKDNSAEDKKAFAIKYNKSKNAWKLGLTFSAGISDISYGFLGSDFLGSGSAEKRLFSNSADLNNSPQAGLDSLSPKKPYLIKPSLALNIGLFATKKISKKSSLTLGINYKPFSTSSTVGKKIDSSNSYRIQYPVNQYKSYYHFIELPVSYSLNITKFKKVPLVLNAGISVSQLIASNALQFNDTSGIYYYDNTLFKKTQLGFTAGIYVSNSKNNLLIGPDIYYATTKISSRGLYKDAHFTYLGLRIKFLFQK